VIPLRFSKSGDVEIEKWYATNFVDEQKIQELKKINTESMKQGENTM